MCKSYVLDGPNFAKGREKEPATQPHNFIRLPGVAITGERAGQVWEAKDNLSIPGRHDFR